ncbi:MAG: hypothetical protein CMK44_04790 [Porticoccus sp.]|jgi:hypothetical protein|nr:hypothetical protein [Porticoccus sp.]
MTTESTIKFMVLFLSYCFIYISGRKKIESLAKQPNASELVKKYGVGGWLIFVSLLTIFASEYII